MVENDFYKHLQPPDPTPPEDICLCEPGTPIKLMYTLGYNPIHCVVCNLEVLPERLKLGKEIVKAIAYWRNLYNAIDSLWLDSDFYEGWAKNQLCNMDSRINLLGREIQQELTTTHKCYYWYFQDESDEEYSPLTNCPVCGELLQEYPRGILKQQVCEKCGLIGSGE